MSTAVHRSTISHAPVLECTALVILSIEEPIVDERQLRQDVKNTRSVSKKSVSVRFERLFAALQPTSEPSANVSLNLHCIVIAAKEGGHRVVQTGGR